MPKNGLKQVTGPASVSLAQMLRAEGVPAIRWLVQSEPTGGGMQHRVMLDLTRSNFLPYSFELDRSKRTRRLRGIMSLWAPTHNFFWTHIQLAQGKIPVEEVRGAFAAAKIRLRQINKFESWRRMGAKVMSIKFELVVDLTAPDLATYAHAHIIFAVPKFAHPRLAGRLAKKASLLTGLKFGYCEKCHDRVPGYFVKHPIKVRWGAGKHQKGHLATLKAAARLNSAQALRIYRATERLDYLSVFRTQPSSSLCTNIESLPLKSAKAVLEGLLPREATSSHVIEQALRVEKQRRAYCRIIEKLRVYPIANLLPAFRKATQTVWRDYEQLGHTGFPIQPAYLDTLNRPNHSRPRTVAKAVWRADLRRIRTLRRAVDVIELNI